MKELVYQVPETIDADFDGVDVYKACIKKEADDKNKVVFDISLRLTCEAWAYIGILSETLCSVNSFTPESTS